MLWTFFAPESAPAMSACENRCLFEGLDRALGRAQPAPGHLEYARKHDFRIDDFIEATASGQASEKRRRLDDLIAVLQRGDRFGRQRTLPARSRSPGQIVAILDALAKAGVAVVAMKENIRVEGKVEAVLRAQPCTGSGATLAQHGGSVRRRAIFAAAF